MGSAPTPPGEGRRLKPDAENQPPERRPPTRSLVERLSDRRLLVRAGPVLVVAGAFGIGLWLGLPAALLTLAAGVLTLVIFLLWSSLSSLAGQSPLSLEEALHLTAPSAEEEQKRNVLRALKDLEFERSVGKISERDYQELSAHYRAEAKRLIQALELQQSPAQEEVERWVNERLEKEGVLSSAPESDAPSEPSSEKEPTASPKAPAVATVDERAE